MDNDRAPQGETDGRTWVRTATAVGAGLAAAALLCVVLYKIRFVFVPFAAGFVVAYVFDPLLDRLETRGWTRHRAVWTVTSLILLALVLLLVLLVPRVVGEVSDAWANWETYAARANEFYDHSRTWLVDRLEQYEDRLPSPDAASYVDEQLARLQESSAKFGALGLKWLGQKTLQAGGLVFLVLLGTLIAFHFMLIIDPMREAVKRLFLSPEQSQEVDETVERVNRMLGAYVRGMAAVSILVAIATWLVLGILGWVFGTEYALVIGLLAGATYAVPWVGQAASAGTAFFFGLVTADHHALLAAVVCLLVVIAINQVADNTVMPKIVGESVGLHPLLVLFAVMAGFQLFGLVGMIIAVPLAASLRIAVRRWIPLLPDDEGKPTGLPRIDGGRLVEALRGAVSRFAGPPSSGGSQLPPL
ncbi:MAG: AI-2E family transporter [Armatimonadetes bacterium]|nr:AI-2E family transporter [Armatimonadota bacterium]